MTRVAVTLCGLSSADDILVKQSNSSELSYWNNWIHQPVLDDLRTFIKTGLYTQDSRDICRNAVERFYPLFPLEGGKSNVGAAFIQDGLHVVFHPVFIMLRCAIQLACGILPNTGHLKSVTSPRSSCWVCLDIRAMRTTLCFRQLQESMPQMAKSSQQRTRTMIKVLKIVPVLMEVDGGIMHVVRLHLTSTEMPRGTVLRRLQASMSSPAD